MNVNECLRILIFLSNICSVNALLSAFMWSTSVLITIIQGASMIGIACHVHFHNFIFCAVNIIQSGPVVETIAYDLLLEAAMHAQHFHSRNLRLHGSWKWLLIEFADYYGVSDSYTKLRCI